MALEANAAGSILTAYIHTYVSRFHGITVVGGSADSKQKCELMRKVQSAVDKQTLHAREKH